MGRTGSQSSIFPGRRFGSCYRSGPLFDFDIIPFPVGGAKGTNDPSKASPTRNGMGREGPFIVVHLQQMGEGWKQTIL